MKKKKTIGFFFRQHNKPLGRTQYKYRLIRIALSSYTNNSGFYICEGGGVEVYRHNLPWPATNNGWLSAIMSCITFPVSFTEISFETS